MEARWKPTKRVSPFSQMVDALTAFIARAIDTGEAKASVVSDQHSARAAKTWRPSILRTALQKLPSQQAWESSLSAAAAAHRRAGSMPCSRLTSYTHSAAGCSWLWHLRWVLQARCRLLQRFCWSWQWQLSSWAPYYRLQSNLVHAAGGCAVSAGALVSQGVR